MTPANTNTGKAISSIAAWNVAVASEDTILERVLVLNARKIGVRVISAAFDLVSYPIGVGVCRSVRGRTRGASLRSTASI